MASDISDAVRELIHERVPSMDHIELLLLLFEQPQRGWSSDELAAELRRPAAAVMGEVELLAAGGLIVGSGEGATRRFIYAPGSAALGAAVTALVDLYRRRPVTLVRLIYSKPSPSVTSFANAFRLRKSED